MFWGGGGGGISTEEASMNRERVCWARVILRGWRGEG
jgi:hypothetical protein